jgi:CelD/BcsL family acetyltransferase involved in cellulose biosynthesis
MAADAERTAVCPRQKPPARSAPAGLPKKPAMKVVVVRDWAELAHYADAWDALAEAALEPNAFYESWLLRPALETYGRGHDLRVVLVLADLPAGSPHTPLLCGVFPLERRRSYKGLPVSVLALWKYVHCYLCTPLVRAAYARPCLEAFFSWLAHDRGGAPLLELRWVPGEGPFQRLLWELLEAQRQPAVIEDYFSRALLCPRDSAKAYLEETLSGERRRRLRKHEERLAEQGPLEYAELEAGADPGPWLDDFLRLEASGWKGQEGTALGCRDEDRRFFLTVMNEASRRGRLLMLALRLAGRPVALACDLLAGPGSYVYKLAFDEAHAACSPGALLELERLRRVHDRPELRWVDSCNAPGPALLKDLWADRRLVETVLIAPGKAPGHLVLAVLPLLRWLRRKAASPFRWLRRRREKAGGPT